MAKRLKPQQIKIIRHRTGVEVPLMFDRNDFKFFAEYGDQKVIEDVASEAEKKVRDLIEASINLTWKPVILVETESSQDRYNNDARRVFLTSERIYVAKFADGQWRQIKWDTFDEITPVEMYGETNLQSARARRASYINQGIDFDQLPHIPDGQHTRRYAFNYNPDLWAALKEIEAGLERLNKKINDLLGTEEGQLKLISHGAGVNKLLK